MKNDRKSISRTGSQRQGLIWGVWQVQEGKVKTNPSPCLLSFPYFSYHIYLLCICVRVCSCCGLLFGGRRSWFSPSALWVSEIRFRPVWAGSILTHWPISPASKNLLKGTLARDTPASFRDHSELVWAKWIPQNLPSRSYKHGLGWELRSQTTGVQVILSASPWSLDIWTNYLSPPGLGLIHSESRQC